jgi:orotate phosphoribosyltransferase
VNLENILKEYSGILKGHFLLSSGLHTDKYIQTAKILQYPHITKTCAKTLLSKIKEDIPIDIVLSPALGAIVIGYELARQLEKPFIFAERQSDDKPKLKLRRGFSLKKHQKVAIVEDVITTGSSIKELVEIVEASQAEVSCILALVDRSQNFKLLLSNNKCLTPISLLKIRLETYQPWNCPLCKDNIPLIKPGSRPT